ncbi:putative Rieske 2Fe-2S iron-sulfur protein YhfW [Arthrobacter sp. Hiyo4]|nr:putative Rieske 2Fe-2S iron-sulfur protein YhfW [Arthrobacter sp. Hiyo4]
MPYSGTSALAGAAWWAGRLRSVSGSGPPTVHTDQGTVTANNVVLATGIPVLDRGLYFTKLKPLRSYAAALELPAGVTAPPGMYLSAEEPTHSLRDYAADGRHFLLVGGHGHQVGRTESEKSHLSGLLDWAAGHFPGAVTTHTWSAQDYQATNLMPSSANCHGAEATSSSAPVTTSGA